MARDIVAVVKYPEVGICGLSCRLCPRYHAAGPSRCGGCKTESRIRAGCPFITCALRKQGIEFCFACDEGQTCDRWLRHRESGKRVDSFKCYQTLEDDIAFIQANGVVEFEATQIKRERFLLDMLEQFNEGRSKSYYCVAATLLDIADLEHALGTAREEADTMDMRERAQVLRAALEAIAGQRGYQLRLRR